MTHELWRTTQTSGYGHGSQGRGGGWAGLKQVVLVRITREYLENDRPGHMEDHYYLTSLEAADDSATDAKTLLAIARGHWAIENRLHHCKDRSMHEDAQQAKKGASTLARLRSLALGLLDQFPGASTHLKQLSVAANPMQALQILGFG